MHSNLGELTFSAVSDGSRSAFLKPNILINTQKVGDIVSNVTHFLIHYRIFHRFVPTHSLNLGRSLIYLDKNYH